MKNIVLFLAISVWALLGTVSSFAANVLLFLAIGAWALFSLPNHTGSHTDQPPPLSVSAAEAPTTLYARGFQIYRCEADPDTDDKGLWVLQSPEAELFSDAAMTRHVGRHYAGPAWESDDGSKVTGKVRVSQKPVTAGAIPWLLLDATPTSPRGLFAGVHNIQRFDTVGGLMPEGTCERPHVGTIVKMPYTATYHFYGASSAS